MKTILKSTHGWAIHSRSPEGHGLIGKNWWFCGFRQIHGDGVSGYQTAVFRTRKMARNALPSVKKSFPKAAVVKVFVDISV